MTDEPDRRPAAARAPGYEAVFAALDGVPPERGEVIAALAAVPRLRDDLDDAERALIDAARECGASWTEIAAALGLRSRQAAEQRRLRLAQALTLTRSRRDPAEARTTRRRQQIVDAEAGERIAELRKAVAALVTALAAAGGSGGRARPSPATDGRAALAHQTLLVALEATPGALVDLTRLAVADLASVPAPPAGQPAVDRALRRVCELTETELERD